jgi:Ser/Thr protein kinase RdoA (MazF antagonist)
VTASVELSSTAVHLAPPPVSPAQLEASLREAAGADAVVHRCAPFDYTTSHPLWHVTATVAGRRRELVLKDLRPGRETPAAAGTRPQEVTDPAREVAVYASRLAGSGLTPQVAACAPQRDRPWVLLELVDGTELWQAADLATWESAARMLARLHVVAGPGAAHGLRRRLLRHDRGFYRHWARRAVTMAPRDRARAVRSVVARSATALEIVLDQPRTLIHGEAVASNVMVRRDGSCLLIDWETAAHGPGLWDLAAMAEGWNEYAVARIAVAYRAQVLQLGGAVPDLLSFLRALDACRLQQCIQWLGWAPDWQPPDAHQKDWLRRARQLADRLES